MRIVALIDDRRTGLFVASTMNHGNEKHTQIPLLYDLAALLAKAGQSRTEPDRDRQFVRENR
jgi:hypothetical protein